LFTHDGQNRIRPGGPESTEKPADDQPEIVVLVNVKDVTKIVNSTTANGWRQGQCSARPEEWNGRSRDDAPSRRVDLDGPPCGIAKIEVDPAIMARNADCGLMFRSFVLGDAPENGQGVGERLTARRATDGNMVLSGEPTPNPV
jgi:hypothetical protein